jgi:tRNA(Arg) A34 adenosine deaminase TadA
MIQEMLQKAFLSSGLKDLRSYRVGAVAIRPDGCLVSSRNISSTDKTAACHAESRLMRKAGAGAIVFVARASAGDTWAMARPCPSCMTLLKARKVFKCYYTIRPGEWGCIEFSNNTEYHR